MNKYYTSGRFAKKANVSLRTIRYYDKIDLLKPTYTNKDGYRYYTDADFAKLQQILSLKFLGFSLDEIKNMTATDKNLTSLKSSIAFQLVLIKKKMEHLQAVEQSLKETSTYLEQTDDIDLERIVELIHITNNATTLTEQYKDARNVNTRISLHTKYSQNPQSWFQWIYSLLPFLKEDNLNGVFTKENNQELDEENHNTDFSILEIGCGNGELWYENAAHVPKSANIVLSDISSGMIQDAKELLSGSNKKLKYAVIDCQQVPYDDCSFDLIIANHMLFYVKDINKALSEVKRVLKPTGIFVCSTYGKKHMQEITSLVKGFDTRVNLAAISLYDIFGLENGQGILSSYFSDIKKHHYDDSLLVPDVEPLLNYIMSCHGNQNEFLTKRYSQFKEYMENIITEKKPFHITKDAGIFICKN